MIGPGRLHACLPIVLAQECPFPADWGNARNYSNNSHDPGGATMCGITQREYDIFRKSKGEALAPVRTIPEPEGEEIYEGSYWLPDCPKLQPGLDLCLFDESVNAGPHEAVKILQAALGIAVDGKWGPQTDLAAKGVFNLPAVINAFTARRENYYRSLAGYPYFGAGWIRRSQTVGAAALKMAAVA